MFSYLASRFEQKKIENVLFTQIIINVVIFSVNLDNILERNNVIPFS